METTHPDLIARLHQAAECWCEATGRTLGALSSRVLNHGSFFDRIGTERPSATTDTLRKFAQFLADPANWPEPPSGVGLVLPEAVCSFLHINGLTAAACGASPDNPPDPIGARTIGTAPAPRGAERDAVRSAASCPPSGAADSAPDADALPPVGRPASGDTEVLP